MIAGVPHETAPGELRVALTPESAAALIESGTAVSVQAGAGRAAGYSDDEFRHRGAEVVSYQKGHLRARRYHSSGAHGCRQSRQRCRRRRAPAPASGPHRIRRPPRRQAAIAGDRRRWRIAVRHGTHAQNHPGPEHGRPVVDGDDRRLQSGHSSQRSSCQECSPSS